MMSTVENVLLESILKKIGFLPTEGGLEFDFGNPLHSVILVGKMHSMEEEMFDYYNVKNKLN